MKMMAIIHIKLILNSKFSFLKVAIALCFNFLSFLNFNHSLGVLAALFHLSKSSYFKITGPFL